MIPKLTTSHDLEDLALELGGSVSRGDGTVFNAGGRMGAQRLRRVPPAEPTPQPAPPQPDIASILQQLVQKMQPAQPVHVQNDPLVIPAPQVTVQAAKRCSWTFDFQRNQDGSIRSITATPQE